MLITLLTIIPASGRREATLEILNSVEAGLRGRTGCLACGVFEQEGEDKAILYFDQWSSLEALSLHVQSDLFLRLLVAMELAACPPTITFYEIANEKGLPWIQRLRVKDMGNGQAGIRT